MTDFQLILQPEFSGLSSSGDHSSLTPYQLAIVDKMNTVDLYVQYMGSIGCVYNIMYGCIEC